VKPYEEAGTRPAGHTRRALVALAAAALCIAPAAAQTWPTKTVRIISPFGAGGSSDGVVRPLAQRLGEVLGQPVIVENQPGANGVISTSTVVKAAPDGHTVLLSNLGPIALSPSIEKKLPYDTLRDLEPVTQLFSTPLVLLVRSDIPLRRTQELIDYARANPGKLRYGSVGQGSTTHLGMELLQQAAKIEMLHAPYKGSAAVTNDLIGGHIDVAFLNVAASVPLVDSGKARALGVTTLRRSGAMPDVPALAELLPGFELNSWWGLMVPAGTPRSVITRLHEESARIMKSPDMVRRAQAGGMDVDASTPEQAAAQIRKDTVRWAEIIKSRGLTFN
jgi:tripartite-type tricarboxylate transporter receptor subunit TctC